jgi:hypothetical protein
MTPTGLAAAIGELVKDLPQPKKPNDSWQRVLTLQLLDTLLSAEDDEPALYAAREAFWDALWKGGLEVIWARPALGRALIHAFGADSPNPTSPTPEEQTAFQASPLGGTISSLVRIWWCLSPEGEARLAGGATPASAPGGEAGVRVAGEGESG